MSSQPINSPDYGRLSGATRPMRRPAVSPREFSHLESTTDKLLHRATKAESARDGFGPWRQRRHWGGSTIFAKYVSTDIKNVTGYAYLHESCADAIASTWEDE